MEVDDQRTQQLGYYKFQSNGITREFEEKESGEKMKTIKNPNFINGGFNNPSSRIIRVSRATGGKDRHSKVWTSKGLRDRRVRLSVPTAIQFYDLQDRLGFDQPSKAVEWLIKAAADSISDLPSLKNTPFPDSEKLMAIHNESIIVDGTSMSKSACSSNSEPDPGSDPSLSRSEIRDRARERAKVRRKEKEKEKELGFTRNQTFTELLTGSINANQENPVRETGSVHQNPARNWISSTGPGTGPLDYFSSELETVSMQMPHHHDHHHHHEMAFIPDHPITMAMPGGGGSYNHDFNIMCFNRGTLQSNNNSPQTFFSTLQRFSSDGGSGVTPPFLMAASPPENLHHHQFQFYYDNGCKNSDSKGKSKN